MIKEIMQAVRSAAILEAERIAEGRTKFPMFDEGDLFLSLCCRTEEELKGILKGIGINPDKKKPER